MAVGVATTFTEVVQLGAEMSALPAFFVLFFMLIQGSDPQPRAPKQWHARWRVGWFIRSTGDTCRRVLTPIHRRA